MGWNIRGQVKAKKGYILVYTILGMVISISIVLGVMKITSSFQVNTIKSNNNQGAKYAINSGIDMVEYYINDKLDLLYNLDSMQRSSQMSVQRERIATILKDIDKTKSNTGKTDINFLLEGKVNYDYEGTKLVRNQNHSMNFKIYINSASVLTLAQTGKFEVAVIGEYVNKHQVGYKVATIEFFVDKGNIYNDGSIDTISLEISDYAEYLKGGTNKWGTIG